MSRTPSRSLDLEPIDRLEEKVKLLVGMVQPCRATSSFSTGSTSAIRDRTRRPPICRLTAWWKSGSRRRDKMRHRGWR